MVKEYSNINLSIDNRITFRLRLGYLLDAYNQECDDSGGCHRSAEIFEPSAARSFMTAHSSSTPSIRLTAIFRSICAVVRTAFSAAICETSEDIFSIDQRVKKSYASCGG